MTKLEEILEKNRLKTDHYADQEFEAYGIISIESAMKEYAEFYAKKCLEIAAKKATTDAYIKSNYGESRWKKWKDDTSVSLLDTQQMYKVNKSSILNIKLPEHD